MTTPKATFAGLALIAALCAGITLGLTALAWAGWDEGSAAYERGDYATAIREWRPLAEQGHALAQFNLGTMYAEGKGVPQDYAEAMKWYRKAAEQGNAAAQNNLGFMYRNGKDVAQDYAEAVKWYRKAAEQGMAEAQNNLGFMYIIGRGVPQDDAEALQWWSKAAEQGHAEAQHNLGFMYQNGKGVPHDDAEAMRWYRKAAEQGYTNAQNNLGGMYYQGHGVPQDYVQAHLWLNLAASRFPPGKYRDNAVKDRDTVAKMMNPAQISEAEKLAREWKEKHKSGEAQTAAAALPPEPEGDSTPSCLRGATFGPIPEDSPLFGRVEPVFGRVVGVQVVDIERDSLAWQMGLRKHDVVVMVNGQGVRDFDEFGVAIRKGGGSLVLAVFHHSDWGSSLSVAC